MTVQVGMVDRSLEARFFDDGLMVVNGGNVIVNDQNKVDGKFGELTEKNEREFRSFFDKIIQVPFW